MYKITNYKTTYVNPHLQIVLNGINKQAHAKNVPQILNYQDIIVLQIILIQSSVMYMTQVDNAYIARKDLLAYKECVIHLDKCRESIVDRMYELEGYLKW